MPKLIARLLSNASAWITLAFIAYATLSPLNERPEINAYGFLFLFSHIDHYIAYAVMGFLFSFAYPRQKLFVFMLILGSAVLLELAQLLTPDRHARVSDALRKTIGGAVGMAIAHFSVYVGSRR